MQNDLGIHTLQEAKDHLRKNWRKGTVCPCCTQSVKLYKRKINAEIAVGLIRVFQRGGARQYVDIWDGHTISGGGDFAKARFWNLAVQKSDEREDGSKRNGMWMLTPAGVDFVRGHLRVSKYALIYNNVCYGLEGEMVDIHTALGDKFNYDELMREVAE